MYGNFKLLDVFRPNVKQILALHYIAEFDCRIICVILRNWRNVKKKKSSRSSGSACSIVLQSSTLEQPSVPQPRPVLPEEHCKGPQTAQIFLSYIFSNCTYSYCGICIIHIAFAFTFVCNSTAQQIWSKHTITLYMHPCISEYSS